MPHREYSGKTDVAKCCVLGRWLLGEPSRGLTIIQRSKLPWDTELATSVFMPAGSLELNKWPGNGCIRFQVRFLHFGDYIMKPEGALQAEYIN